MKILVIGSGGREHALVWKLAQSKRASQLFCAPGNAGIAELAQCAPIAATDTSGLAAFVIDQHIDLTIVGPEAPLCAGIVDTFQAKRLKIFGPNRRAAQLEASKAFAKEFLLRHGIPTASAEIFSDANAARAYVRAQPLPIVVKADGLAAGKGVTVAQTLAEAEGAIALMMEQHAFGDAGARVVIEECLRGEELSAMALVDGKSFKLLATAQDHKRIFDGDRGPNTGGMGAYSPTPLGDAKLAAAIHEVFAQSLAGLRADGIDYRGVLYAGLMLTAEGPKVLEFNCRFGDPETQVVVPRMDFDLVGAVWATMEGRLEDFELRWKPQTAVCVVIAAGGYPGAYQRGHLIEGLKEASTLANVTVFHAGTARDAAGRVVTDGGRVLGVTALSETMADAARAAYQAVERIRFDGAQFRRDIGARALRARE